MKGCGLGARGWAGGGGGTLPLGGGGLVAWGLEHILHKCSQAPKHPGRRLHSFVPFPRSEKFPDAGGLFLKNFEAGHVRWGASTWLDWGHIKAQEKRRSTTYDLQPRRTKGQGVYERYSPGVCVCQMWARLLSSTAVKK